MHHRCGLTDSRLLLRTRASGGRSTVALSRSPDCSSRLPTGTAAFLRRSNSLRRFHDQRRLHIQRTPFLLPPGGSGGRSHRCDPRQFPVRAEITDLSIPFQHRSGVDLRFLYRKPLLPPPGTHTSLDQPGLGAPDLHQRGDLRLSLRRCEYCNGDYSHVSVQPRSEHRSVACQHGPLSVLDAGRGDDRRLDLLHI